MVAADEVEAGGKRLQGVVRSIGAQQDWRCHEGYGSHSARRQKLGCEARSGWELGTSGRRLASLDSHLRSQVRRFSGLWTSPARQLRRSVGAMRFAFKTSPQETTWTDMLAVWKEADDIELFESGWTFDHFYPIFSDSSGPCLEGWTTLTALAQATSRLRMGTLVTGIHYRHPAVLANMASTLDIVSGGRLELGIGAGWNEEESGAYGSRWARPPSAAIVSKKPVS